MWLDTRGARGYAARGLGERRRGNHSVSEVFYHCTEHGVGGGVCSQAAVWTERYRQAGGA